MKSITVHALLATLCLLFSLACSDEPGAGDHPEQIAGGPDCGTSGCKTQQALTSFGPCGPPSGYHRMALPASYWTRIDSEPWCEAAYAWGVEPERWHVGVNSTRQPARADGRCSCVWTSNTSWPLAQNNCHMQRSFRCGYGAGCAYSITYSARVFGDSATGSWTNAKVHLVTAEPGCVRTIEAPFNWAW